MNMLFIKTQPIGATNDNMTGNNATTTTIKNLTNHNQGIVLKEFQQALLFIVLITGVIFNAILILVVIVRRKNETRYKLLTSLAVSNLMACALIISLKIATLISAPSRGVRIPCDVLLAIEDIWWITQNWTLLTITYDRYKSISNPFQYKYSRGSCRSIVLIWIPALVFITIFLVSSVNYTYDQQIYRCRVLWEFHLPYVFTYPIFAALIPGFFLTYYYIYMMSKSYKAKRKEPKSFSSALKRSLSVGSRDSFSAKLTRRRISNSGSSSTTGKIDGEGSTNLYTIPGISEASDFYGARYLRKRSIANNKFKPFISTLLVLVPFLSACVADTVLIYLYLNSKHQNSATKQKIDLLDKVKYILVAYYPYLFGWRDKEIKKDLRRLYRRLRCWKSSDISPSVNIDSNDYPENVIRRDSRRNSSSSVISRRSSMLVSEEPHSSTQSPYYKNNTCKMTTVYANRDPTEIFYVNSHINMPVVNC